MKSGFSMGINKLKQKTSYKFIIYKIVGGVFLGLINNSELYEIKKFSEDIFVIKNQQQKEE
jgi:hypothetical protein